MENVTNYFGKGEYALTSKNIVKVTEALDRYNKENKWQWSCQDVLGVKGDGKIGVRFEAIKKELQKIEGDEKVYNLLNVMAEVTEKDPSILIKNPRFTSEEVIAKKRENLKAKLSSVDNLTEEQIENIIGKLA